MKGHGPKLLLDLNGRSMLERCASAFLRHDAVGEIVAVVPETLLEAARGALRALHPPRGARLAAVSGGATRQESVRLGLAALERGLGYVAVHDVARPVVTAALIGRVLDAARAHGAAIPALPIRDTVKEVDGARVVRSVPRERLWGAQTPQIFARDILARAHALGRERSDATDDAALVEAAGAAVVVVPGEPSNVKITEPADLRVARSLLRFGAEEGDAP